MIELFARRPVNLDLPEDANYTRVPVDQDMVSLSAILLDDAYFEALQTARPGTAGIAGPGVAAGIAECFVSPAGRACPASVAAFRGPG